MYAKVGKIGRENFSLPLDILIPYTIMLNEGEIANAKGSIYRDRVA